MTWHEAFVIAVGLVCVVVVVRAQIEAGFDEREETAHSPGMSWTVTKTRTKRGTK